MKICGVTTADAVAAAVAGGARYVGFVFYPRSPRAVSPEQARALAATLPDAVTPVAVTVDPDEPLLAAITNALPGATLQLHGKESPARAAAIKRRFGRPLIKAIAVADAADINRAAAYDDVADLLMFDAKAPVADQGALPGGNGVPFDWTVLKGRTWSKPWLLSGGLNRDNVGEAVRLSGARAVDVSSGVEDRPGRKNPALITAFLKTVKQLKT